MIDLTGPVLTLIRSSAAVTGITSQITGGELAPDAAPPAVTLRMLTNTRSPTGRGHARMGLQQPRYRANCYAATYTQASQLAGAVSDALHLTRARVVSGKTIHQIMEDGRGGPVLDPKTKWVTETVIFEVTGAA